MSGNSSSPLILGGVRNSIIGGDFSTNLWQRGTAMGTSSGAYTADRWKCGRASGVGGQTVSRATLTLGDVPGTLHALRSQRDSGNSSTAICVMCQGVSTLDSLALNNKIVTLSFWARAGNDFSGSLTAQIYFGQGTNQDLLSGFSGATSVSGSIGITPTWKKFTLTTYAGGFTQIGAYFAHQPAGTASTNDFFEIAQVQLAPSLPGDPFLARSAFEEHNLCLSYFVHHNTIGSYSLGIPVEISTPNSSDLFVGWVPFPVPMRTTPSVTITNPNTGHTPNKTTAYPDTPSELSVDNVFGETRFGFRGFTVTVSALTYYYAEFSFDASAEL